MGNCAAGTDRAFRMFSSIQDQQSTELSQHHVERRAKRLKITQQELKLPEVIALHACQVRPACQHEAVGAACLAGLLAATAAGLAVLWPLPSWKWLVLLAACMQTNGHGCCSRHLLACPSSICITLRH